MLRQQRFERKQNIITTQDEKTSIHFLSCLVKTGAGRPRGGQQPQQIMYLGDSLGAPMKPEYSHEMLIAASIVKVFRHIRTLAEGYHIQNVVFQWCKNGLYITQQTELQTENAVTSVFFDAKLMHYYYCERPINLIMSYDQFKSHFTACKADTHYVLIQIRAPLEGISADFRSFIHTASNVFGARQFTNTQLMYVPDSSIKVVPPPQEFYLLEIVIDTSMLRTHITQSNTRHLTIEKQAGSTDIMLYNRSPNVSNICLPIDSNNVIFNNLSPEQSICMSVNMQYLTTLGQIGDATNMLHICIHPNFPVVMFYKMDITTTYGTQYEVPSGVKVYAGTIAVYMPQSQPLQSELH